ncbi:MAG: cytochrome c biogenesis protein CcdA, partial [Bacteroidota bacterium]|nr:cytochrome c biogenesis protein CcdA [Bacteroidota bacterium]
EVAGCTNAGSINYDPNATDDDGSCDDGTTATNDTTEIEIPNGLPCPTGCDHLVDFSTQTIGESWGAMTSNPTYPLMPGDFMFAENGIDLYVDRLNNAYNPPTYQKNGIVSSPWWAFGSGQVMHTNNATVTFDLDSIPTDSVCLDFLDLGGYEFLEVNGVAFSSFNGYGELAAASGTMGSVQVHLVNTQPIPFCGGGHGGSHGGDDGAFGMDDAEDDAPMGLYDPVQWDLALHADEGNAATIVATAVIEEGWHVYSHDNDPLDGPIPTAFTIATEGVEVGDLRECTPEVHYDPNFDKDVKSFEGTVRWALDVSWTGDRPETIDGLLTYMTCDDTKCIFPPDVEFYLALDDARTEAVPELCPGDAGTVTESEEEEMGDGLWVLFLLGMGLGFAALFTPCVFPLIPMTVSFFTKQSKTRAEGIRNALIYGASIIFIYTGLGLLLTAVFGVDVLNLISTDPYFNLFLFLLLIVFGVSFLGAFEIQLPTSWANKVDAQADRGGLIGIFFMAATLAIVSFSCTGPLVGSALAGAATGDFGGPIAVMFGFSLALAIPFALFSAFPGWLNSLPQSGGWLTSVKVVLGLLEIGFAFKFLSNADLVLQLGLLKRELFIAIWIAVALCIAIYLYGGLRFPHDSKLERMSVGRWGLGTVFLVLAIYMMPGLWGAPLKIIAGFPPPMFYSESSGSVGGSHGGSSDGHSSSHIEARFRDYEEGLAAARAEGKPMILDFTGWACVNCRKMEEQVWPDATVAEYLTEKTVLVSLYVDERKALPEDHQRVEEFGGKDFRIRTVGNKWTYLQASRFGTNAQPFYVMIDHNGEALGDGVGYDPDPQKFIDFLKENYARFEAGK